MKDVTRNFCQTPGVLVLLKTTLQLEPVREGLGGLSLGYTEDRNRKPSNLEYLKGSSALSAVT